MFDDATSTSLELLRFKPEIGDSQGFETALRSRVEQLASLRHPALGAVKSIERRGPGEGLMLVSRQTAGRRLSEILHAARGAAFALDFLNQIGPAVVALQKHGAGIAHGILTVDRIIVGREGRLVLVEHVLGSALASLDLTPARTRELGIAVPDKPAVSFDPRLDVIQLGFVALTLLLGRRVDPSDYPAGISQHLDQVTKEDTSAASLRLRQWVERALQLGKQPFANAGQALEAFAEVASAAAPATPAVEGSTSRTASASRTVDAVASSRTEIPDRVLPADETFPSENDHGPLTSAPREPKRKVTVMLGLLAAVEAVVIAGLVYTRPTAVAAVAADVAAEAPAVAAPPPTPTDTDTPALIAPPGSVSAAPLMTAAPPAPAPAAKEGEPAVPAGSRVGGIKIAAPIDLQVLEDGRVIGSTAGPIAINDGTHTVELVNEALGFRFKQPVHVKPGQLTTINISVPNGRVSINASPWADVWIDGAAAGQTPLANLTLPIGSHEIVFRHPQLGEQKQSVTIKADGLTRVSAVLQK